MTCATIPCEACHRRARLAPALAFGQEVELGPLLDKGAAKLAKADLEALVPGTNDEVRAVHHRPAGQSTVDYSWENPPGGATFRAYGRGRRLTFDGTGTWRISGDGRYCWDITFNRQWKSCRFVFKAGRPLLPVAVGGRSRPRR